MPETRVLVTGATGFVGKVVCRRLVEAGYDVLPLTRKVVPDLATWDGTHAPWLDGVDAIVHLASLAHSRADEAAYQRLNVEGTKALASAAARANVRRFIYMSSVKAVGERGSLNDQSYPSPEDAYGRSKLAAETWLREHTEATVLRPPLVIGPGVKGNFLSLLKIVKRGFPLPLKDVRNERSFVYVENLADSVVVALADSRSVGQTYFVADSPPLSTETLVKTLAEAMGKKPRLIRGSSLLGFGLSVVGKSGAFEKLTGSLVVDGTKIQKELSWTPPYSLSEGLRRTVEWFQQSKLPDANAGVLQFPSGKNAFDVD